MQVIVTVNEKPVTVKALTYAFPRSPKSPEDYVLYNQYGTVLGVAVTGGGKYPTYVYFISEGVSYYLPKNVTPDNGTRIVVAEPEAEQVEQPKADAEEFVAAGMPDVTVPKTKRQRRAAASAA